MDYLAMKEAKKRKFIIVVLVAFIMVASGTIIYCYTHYTFSKFDVYNQGDGSLEIYVKDKYKNSVTDLTIPEYIHGKKVKYIRLTHLNTVNLTIPSEIQTLDISDCLELRRIDMPDILTGPTDDSCFISLDNMYTNDYPELSQLTMVVKEGSKAEEYAKKHNIAIQYK